EWVHVQLHQQKGMISLSPPTICNSAENFDRKFNRIEPSSVADSASDSCFTKPFYVFMLKFLALR
ncbi:hypothetical protein, partial [Escherichia coli]|uniref:hypothetical protein n=1 Tax=Escherichia coli TaxID=562 RepID=UPI001FF22588